jgi:hypothetical protein
MPIGTILGGCLNGHEVHRQALLKARGVCDRTRARNLNKTISVICVIVFYPAMPNKRSL